MSLELTDFRLKITPETVCVLAAQARANDIEKPELARDVLHEWALRHIEGATLLVSCLRAKGLQGAAEGITSADRRTSAQSGASLEWGEP